MTAKKIRRLFWDIETSPNVVLSWRVGNKINLTPDNIVDERKIVCICCKWEGEKKVFSFTWDALHNDRDMCEKFAEVLKEADEVVGHNLDKFDIKWVHTRLLFHGISSPLIGKSVDTLKLARKAFNFNSNKLDYIAKYLGEGEKLKTGFGLWREVVLGRGGDALREMVRYCKMDVLVLERVWKRLIKFFPQASHVGVLNGNPNWSCPYCGGTDVSVSKKRVSSKGIVSYQMQCKSCGHYYTISQTAYKAYASRNS